MNRLISLIFVCWLAGCTSTAHVIEADLPEEADPREAFAYADASKVPVVPASIETIAVATTDDAADDPAIWINRDNPATSLVLGTDKKAGVAVYTLTGELQQFLAIGRPNNIDVRQDLDTDHWPASMAIASNRLNDTVSIMIVDGIGIELLGEFNSTQPEPYGACLAIIDTRPIVFITYKTGMLVAHEILGISDTGISEQVIGQAAFSGQLEGCVVDESNSRIYIGEETRGLWRVDYQQSRSQLFFGYPASIDQVDSPTGITADIEGVALYHSTPRSYLVVSSQGNDSYAVYAAEADNEFLGRFRIGSRGSIDGVQETDGVAVTSANLGPEFPRGLMVVQDGFNAPAGSTQNFKYVDWRDIERALSLPISPE